MERALLRVSLHSVGVARDMGWKRSAWFMQSVTNLLYLMRTCCFLHVICGLALTSTSENAPERPGEFKLLITYVDTSVWEMSRRKISGTWPCMYVYPHKLCISITFKTFMNLFQQDVLRHILITWKNCWAL